MELSVENQGLTSINNLNLIGIEILCCNDNKLTFLPELPTSITDLYCYNNQLTTLPDLPEGLQLLSCFGNKLTNLPRLPKSLKYLFCLYNDIKELPDLPYGLIQLSYRGNFTPKDNCLNEQLKQYNNKRIVLGMQIVDKMPNETEWDNINDLYTRYLYSVDGDKYKEIEKEFIKMIT